MHCLCVGVYYCHRVSTQLQLNIPHHISYHIISLCWFNAVNLLSVMYVMNIYVCRNIVRVYLRCWILKYHVFVKRIMLCEEALFKRTG